VTEELGFGTFLRQLQLALRLRQREKKEGEKAYWGEGKEERKWGIRISPVSTPRGHSVQSPMMKRKGGETERKGGERKGRGEE